VDRAIEIQRKRYSTNDESEKSRLWQELQAIQKQIDKKVEEIYGMYNVILLPICPLTYTIYCVLI
jgi:hypothetical protein